MIASWLASLCVSVYQLPAIFPAVFFITHHYADHYLIKAFFWLRAFCSVLAAREHHQLVGKDKWLQ